jgi:Tol biopolymer transport system component
MMLRTSLYFVFAALFAARAIAAEPLAGQSPADHLPPHIVHLTSFGERADWSKDGKRILFLSKTFGDAMEIDLATKAIRNLTDHYPHHGYTRAHYLANGDILLSGPQEFDPQNAAEARNQCFLYVLDRGLTKPPEPLGVRCSEGPAMSRKAMRIAWTEWGVGADVSSQINVADIVYEDGKPRLANRKSILNDRDLPFRCRMETQNFRPPDEHELVFSAYSIAGDKCDVCSVDLETKKVTKYTDSPDDYDEPEGIFPDGQSTLVECDRQNHQGPGHIDLWRLALDGSGRYERLTHFSDYPGYKASNPVVSNDGRFIAFQMAKSGDAAGVGHGIFIYDLNSLNAAP